MGLEPDVELMSLKPDDKDLLLKEEGTEIEFWFFLLCKDCISRRGSLAWLVCACLLKPSTMGCWYYLGCSRTWIHTDSGFEWPPKVFSSPKVTWKFLVKKLFNGIFFYRSTLSITFTTVETLRLFPLCLWTMLQRVKVGHICTLSNGYFYSKVTPDIFSTLFFLTRYF